MTTYADCAVVRCGACPHHPVICRLTPTVLDNGFTIRKNAVLHSVACNICQPGLVESTLVEVNAWERTVRQHKPQIVVPGLRKQR
jgi:Fe-S-cluster containining protein